MNFILLVTPNAWRALIITNRKKRKKKELGEQGENQINVCKFLDGSPWSFGLVPALWSQLTSNIITCGNLN